jgi:hypothetical protein
VDKSTNAAQRDRICRERDSNCWESLGGSSRAVHLVARYDSLAMPTPVTTSNNLHTVAMYGQPLGVECRGCGRRALAFAGKVDALRGSMRELRTLRFVCSSCRSRDWQGWLLLDDADRVRFLGHLPPGPSFA